MKSAQGDENCIESRKNLRVILFDLWSTVPYYDAHLCKALERENVTPQLAAITYHLDSKCFARFGLKNNPGLIDFIGRIKLPTGIRRILKFTESLINMAWLAGKMIFVRPQILHVQYLPLLRWNLKLPDFLFLWFARTLGVKVVYTVHDVLPHDSGATHEAMFRELYSKMDALICHTDGMRQELHRRFGVSQSKIHVIPHGLFTFSDTLPSRERARLSLSLEEDEVFVLWQGIIFPYKGVDFLLDAWRVARPAIPHARLLVAGTGSPELLDKLEQKRKSLGLENSVRFDFRFISVEELLAVYRAADVVVYPYREITTSGALMTGVAFEKAIIATDLPSFREVLRHNETACLVPYGDTEALAQALTALAGNPRERQRLERAVRERVCNQFSWQRIANLTIECYRKVLASS